MVEGSKKRQLEQKLSLNLQQTRHKKEVRIVLVAPRQILSCTSTLLLGKHIRVHLFSSTQSAFKGNNRPFACHYYQWLSHLGMGSHENQSNLIITSSSDMTSPASPKDTAPEQPQPPLGLDQEPRVSTETAQDTPETSEKNIDDDAFGDFGTTQDALESSDAKDEDDSFGDFGSSESSFKGADDDDEFGDFGATSAPITTGDDNDGFGDFGEVQGGDDDFGDFNDFADGDGFQDSGDFGDFEAGNGGEDLFGSSKPVAEPTPIAVVEEEPVEVAMPNPGSLGSITA